MRVLILEDDDIIRDYFVMLVKSVPGVSQVEATSSGEEAISLAISFAPDLVLLDYELSGQRFNGFEIGEKILTNQTGIYLLLITGFPPEYFSNQPLKPHGFIVKPIIKEKFKALVESFVELVGQKGQCPDF